MNGSAVTWNKKKDRWTRVLICTVENRLHSRRTSDVTTLSAQKQRLSSTKPLKQMFRRELTGGNWLTENIQYKSSASTAWSLVLTTASSNSFLHWDQPVINSVHGGHPYHLPSINSSVFKAVFINRCLFSFVWLCEISWTTNSYYVYYILCFSMYLIDIFLLAYILCVCNVCIYFNFHF